MACRKCGSGLYECPDCEGQTKTNPLGEPLTCKTCRNTGQLCPVDGGYWT